jgi:ECF transporter S component (folate family)
MNNQFLKRLLTFRFDLKSLVTLGMLLAAFVVLDVYFNVKIGDGFKFNLSFIPAATAGALFGPLPAALLCVCGDLIGCVLTGGSPIWQLTVTAGLTGLIYGMLLFARTGKSLVIFAIIARVTDSIIITACLNTAILMSVGFVSPTAAGFTARLLKAVIEMPIYSALLVLLLPRIVTLYNRIAGQSPVKT